MDKGGKTVIYNKMVFHRYRHDWGWVYIYIHTHSCTLTNLCSPPKLEAFYTESRCGFHQYESLSFPIYSFTCSSCLPPSDYLSWQCY